MKRGKKGYPRSPRTPLHPPASSVLRLGPGSAVALSHLTNRAVFEVRGWAPALSCTWANVVARVQLLPTSPLLSLSLDPPVCICIQNKQEIVLICMQMCLSPRLGLRIKSFTDLLISNYTQTPIWALPPSRGGCVCRFPPETYLRQSKPLDCHLRKLSRNLDLMWSTDLQIDRLHHAAISS